MANRRRSPWHVLQLAWRISQEADRLAKLLLPGRAPTEWEWRILMGLASVNLLHL
jgi:hypothetical protein